MLAKIDKGQKRVKSKKYQGVYIYPSSTREGDECYYIVYRISGKTVTEKVGWKSEGYSQDKANAVRIERVHGARHGQELPGKNGNGSLTFGEAFSRWLEDQGNKGIKGYKNLVGIHRKHISKMLDNLKMQDVTPLLVNKVSRKMVDSGSRPGTVHNVHYIIRATYKHAVTHGGYQGKSPLEGVPAPKSKVRRERYLSKEEARELLQSMKVHGGDQHYLFTAIGLFTGMRLSEILGIKGQDIDYVNGTIRVMGKGDKVRHCEVPTDLMSKIHEVNPRPNEKLIKGVTNWTFRRIVERMGLNKDVTPGDRINSVSVHTLRHTYGSWLAADGTPITVIKELMGHTDISTTMRYLKNAPRAGAAYAANLTRGMEL